MKLLLSLILADRAFLFFWIFGLSLFCFRSISVAPLAGRQVFLLFWVFGLSLYSCRSISVAPVRGGTYFSLSSKEK